MAYPTEQFDTLTEEIVSALRTASGPVTLLAVVAALWLLKDLD